MAAWTSLVAMSVVAVSALGMPREYNIPDVANGPRSQYYVLHDDGSFKYGFNTGDDAFESQKTSVGGDVEGKFGYTDPEGQEIRVEYTSGQGGFVASGDHIPQVHPDVAAAFAAARSSKPFFDPLAGFDGDKSYNFNFKGEEHSRNEVSDDDGTVSGSYSYVDEFGRTRSYTYRAGKGIGFVIEGDDIPQQVQPVPTHSSSQVQHAHQQTRYHAGSHTRASAQRQITGSRQALAAKPAQTYFAPAQSSTGAATRTASSRNYKQQTSFGAQAQTSATRTSGAGSRNDQQAAFAAKIPFRPTTSTRTDKTVRRFEPANTRTSFSPSGSYSLAYETSSHSRQEEGDDDNNVRGGFSFVADDDNVDRSLTYEAGAGIGFVAQGKHLPIGAIVPGAPSGQVTGRITKVVQIPFIDPLADGELDASFNFGFESETYSRSETADEDGNVSGTYSILGDDGILRTYRYRAGKGIGFETEEISAVPARSRPQLSSYPTSSSHRQQSSSVSQGSSHRAATGGGAPRTPVVTSYIAPQHTSHSSRVSAQSAFSGTSANRATQFTSSGANNKFGTSNRGASFTSTRTSHDSPNFSLNQYNAEDGHGKYGYVIRYDD